MGREKKSVSTKTQSHRDVHSKHIRAQKNENIPAKHLEQRFIVLLELRKEKKKKEK